MSNKSHSIILVFVGLLFFAANGKVLADASTSLEMTKSNIVYLIEKGKYPQAQARTQELLADFPTHPSLPEALYWITERYERTDRLEDAKRNYQQIMQNYPSSSWAGTAKLGVSRAEVKSLIAAQNYNRAEEALEKLIADFSERPDLPEALYWITERYERTDRFEDAKRTYQRIIQNYPDSPWAGTAKLAISRAEVKSLIVSQNYDQANTALNKMVTDFSEHPDLPEALYWITERYERASKFENAQLNYKRIIEIYPGSPWASKAELGFSRAEVMSLIASQKYKRANNALNKMIIDFSSHPDLPETLYWITERYERTDRFEDAKHNYQRIIRNYPHSPWASKAKLGVPKAEILSFIVSQEHARAEETLDKMAADFNDHPDLPEAIFAIGDEYYKLAFNPADDPKLPKTDNKAYFQRALTIWKRIIEGLPETIPTVTANAYRSSAECYRRLEQYPQALEHYQIEVNNWPDNNENAWWALYNIGLCYQKMEAEGAISESEANQKTRLAYQQLLEKYPDCQRAQEVKKWLEKHSPE
jgi:TolA-binding protein